MDLQFRPAAILYIVTVKQPMKAFLTHFRLKQLSSPVMVTSHGLKAPSTTSKPVSIVTYTQPLTNIVNTAPIAKPLVKLSSKSMPKKSKNDTFTERVKDIVRSINRGETKSYKEVATLAGNSKAARAVARIMAANYDETVPCHRVIRSDGSYGGYNRGGEAVKRAIVAKERGNI
jgi:methylated-DNA-[protein]-cysteine S-methyltransferase